MNGGGNKRLRTRKDLLRAAAQLVARGDTPTMEAVAEAALVSRATAYRYFQSIEDLLVELPIDESVPAAESLFTGGDPGTAEARLDAAESVMHESVCQHEAQLRLMMAQSLQKSLKREAGDTTPVRQQRRVKYIETALAPHKSEFDSDSYKKLVASLTLVFGPEAMIVFRDVYPLSTKTARAVKRWMIQALVDAARSESKRPRKRRS